MRLLMRILWIAVSAFLVFFLNALTYNPGADMRYYASELICLNRKTSHLCTAETTRNVHVFRSEGDSVALQQNMNVSYVSKSFNSLIGLALDNRDTYREVLLKVFAVKSAVASLLISLVAYLAQKYRHLHQIVVRLITGMFSVPFLWQGVAGPYPAGIAILGMLLASLVLIIVGEHRTPLSNPGLLLGSWFIGVLMVVTNRFDTSAFLVAMVVVFFIRQHYLSSEAVHLAPVLRGLVAVLAMTISLNFLLNDKMRELLQQAISRDLVVVPDEVSSRSEQFVESTGLSGDLAFSLMAPITMIDNGTRAFVNGSYGPLFFESSHGPVVRIGLIILVVVAVVLAWIPLGICSASFVADSVARLQAETTRRKQIASLLLIGLPLLIYFLVPWYVRGIWSLPYVLPLFLILALSSDTRRPLRSYEKLCFSVMFASNISAVTVINVRLGDVYVLGMQYPTLVVVSALTASTAALLLGIFQLPEIPEDTSVAT